MIGICKRCEKLSATIKNRRRNTAYVDDESNWLKVCKKCQIEDDEYYDERWAEYYAGRL